MSNDDTIPSGPLNGPPPRRRLTKARKRVFLEVLAQTGSVPCAANAATPWAKGERYGAQTFRDERVRDPKFAAQWKRAEEEALAAVEKELWARAMNPPKKPVWSRGEVVGEVEDRNSSDKLLLRLAARLNPEWRERATVDTNVTVKGAILSIVPEDLLLLSEPQQRLMLELLETIGKRKGERDEVPRLRTDSPPADGR